MTTADQIHALETLASMDAELRTLDEQIAQERSTLNGLKAQLKAVDEKLSSVRASLGTMEKTRGEHVQDVRNMTQQLEHSRDKLNRSRTERESQAATREMEELRKLVRDREEELGRLTTEVDTLRKQQEEYEAEHKRISDDLAAREGDISSRLNEVETQRKAKGSQRDVATKSLPPAIYRRYEMIRQKKGFAIAQTSADGTCRACNMSLPPQLFHRLRREPVIEQCPSCFRLIYFTAVKAESAPTPSK